MAAPLDLNLLKTFVAVVESGSLSNAAPRVGRS
ncbi:LysR family transcriptional regulator [Mesorhizobium sp. AR02]|nr:LysR family transcriptional regulator [Mesorhizobium sp. AR02]